MFYGKGSDEPLFIFRKMIISKDRGERRKAFDELFPYVKKDIKATLEAMDRLPVAIRLLDPPLHEFVPQRQEKTGRAGQRPEYIWKNCPNGLRRSRVPTR